VRYFIGDLESALMDKYEKCIREKVFNSGILTNAEWVYLVGLFQTAREHEECDRRDPKPPPLVSRPCGRRAKPKPGRTSANGCALPDCDRPNSASILLQLGADLACRGARPPGVLTP
jgi:hypothetical protein